MPLRFGIVFLLILVSLSCAPANKSDIAETHPAPTAAASTPEPTPTVTSRTIDFEGVSFTYDPSVFGNVESKLVPDYPLPEPDYKPERVEPEHVDFAFAYGGPDNNALLAVFPLDKFPEMYAKDPHSVKWMKENIAALRQVLKNKDYRLDGDIPHLRFEDVSVDFFANVHYLTFDNGKGVVFVSHWTIDDLVSNRNLIYRFEGITTDGRWYVTAEMPIRVDFLPDEPPDEFEGFTLEDRSESEEKTRKYLDSISSRLAKLKPDEYKPSLSKFEEIISSLKIAR